MVCFHEMLLSDRRAKDAWDGNETFLLVCVRREAATTVPGSGNTSSTDSRAGFKQHQPVTGLGSRGVWFQLARAVKDLPFFIRPVTALKGIFVWITLKSQKFSELSQ